MLSNGSLSLLEQILPPKLNGNYTETNRKLMSSHESHGKPQETPLKAFKNQRFLMESLCKPKENLSKSKENRRFLMESLCKPKENLRISKENLRFLVESVCKPKVNLRLRMNCLQTKGKPPLSKETL